VAIQLVDDHQESFSITRELNLAGARDGSKLRNGSWTARGHFRKRLVVEDDIGWYVLCLGQFQQFDAQLIEENAVGGRKRLCCLALSRFPFRPGFLQDP